MIIVCFISNLNENKVKNYIIIINNFFISYQILISFNKFNNKFF